MSDTHTRPQLAHYYRYLWRERNLMFVLGDASKIFLGQHDYNLQYHIDPGSEEATAMLNSLLAAAGLASMLVYERESWGWSVTLTGSSVALFCGVEPEGMICGRVGETDPDRSLVVLQRQREGEPMRQSRYEPQQNCVDVVKTVNTYFDQVEQTATRLVVDAHGAGVAVQAMPQGSLEGIADLPDDQFLAQMREVAASDQVEPIGEKLLFYQCRCSEQMIRRMVLLLPQDQRAELWGDLKDLEVECPRCARRYYLDRQFLEEKPE